MASQSSRTPAEAGSPREILVMLKLAPPHFRPNSGYGGSYGDAQSTTARRRTAQQIARSNGLQLIDSWPMPLLGIDCYVMRLPSGLSAEAAIAQVTRHPMVAWSQPMHEYRSKSAVRRHGDPLSRAAPAATSWRLADLHRVATGRGVSIAVIDSKVETSHPDLAGQFVVVKDFVSTRPTSSERHGTGVAGVIGAKANNGIGMAGIAPGARLMALRACWQTGSTGSPTICNSLSLARALHFAIQRRAQVINLSVSGPSDVLIQKLIFLAQSSRTTVVAAFDPNLPAGGFPASQPGVIAVAEDSLQNIPSRVYAAPGRNVPTTQPGGRWNFVSGSSYAAAHVSGLAALVRQERRSPQAITFARSADGSIDACGTLLHASGDCVCRCGALRQAERPARP
ncbi:MAG TPA: S8 family serine peptidase [Sphingomicrobium sp.]|nr:S8 family serine peptidase [Sphingomicrobium sp.]